jgi:uncharacterized membrane protein
VHIRRTIRLVLAAVLATGIGVIVPSSPALAAPTRYYLDVPSGADDVDVYAINNNGTIVGAVDDRAVKWNANSGEMTYLPRVPGYPHAKALDINSDGVIVGRAAESSTNQIGRPVRWKASGAVDFLAPEGSAATTISNDNQIAGWSGAAFGPRAPVRFVNGRTERLTGAPTHGTMSGIAEGGAVTGHFQGYMCAECRPHGYVQTRGHDPVMLPTTNDAPSTTAAISADGRKVAGTVNNQAVTWSLAIIGDYWTQTTLGNLRPGWNTTSAGMSRSGTVVVGNAESGDNFRAWAHVLGFFTELPGGQAVAVDVNDSGVVVGYDTRPWYSNARPVVWR